MMRIRLHLQHATPATDTVPAAVQALYLAGNEIATHTLTHVAYPSAQEIVGCRDWLTNKTGIPKHKINGFRAPFLLHNAATRRALAAAGFLYDSSLPDTAPSDVSPSVRQRAFPYRMDAGIPQTCETGSCSASERWPLWEVPLWAAADAAGRPIASMDPAGDAYEIYKRELGWRLGGNRAPLGLFLHAGAESAPERIAQLRKFVQYAAAQKDVCFVTNQQLLAWMAQPVPASAIAAQLGCKTPTDIAAGVKACSTFVSDCKFGTWDGRKCRCVCMGEGAPGGFCRSRTGECSLSC